MRIDDIPSQNLLQIQDTKATPKASDSAADNHIFHLVKGDQPLYQTMLTLNEEKLNLSLIVQIRNRLVSAYQEFMKEQV